jgi:hypothetical protein
LGNVIYSDILCKPISMVGWKSFHGWFKENITELLKGEGNQDLRISRWR